MKIISYNVNGIRSALSKNLLEWIKTQNADIICFQETKAHKEQLDLSLFETLGYQSFWFSAEKKGYSSVAILTKIIPKHVEYGCNHTLFDAEGRVLRIDFDNFSLFNIYFPSGTSGEERQEIKYQFLDYIFDYLENFKKQQANIIVLGDYNIAHTDIDIHNPKSNANSSGFLPEERAWLTKYFKSGMIDSFRLLNPETKKYSWWSFRAGARNKNLGWRIDYIAISQSIQTHLEQAEIYNEAFHSDHCPISINIKL